MQKRWRLGLLFVVPVACVGGYVVLLAQPRPGVTWENIAKIQEGMTRAEVEALMGGPGDYTGTNGFFGQGSTITLWSDESPTRDTAVTVLFRPDGTVVVVSPMGTSPEPLLDRIRRILFGR
jgi:hypothetical protein